MAFTMSRGSPGTPPHTPGHGLPVFLACCCPRLPFQGRVSHQIQRHLLSSLPAARAIHQCTSWRTDYYGLVYGCDYSVPERSTAYMCLTFYEPIRYCIARGLGRLRLGFEAFVPKPLRSATVTPRETWVWTPDRQLLEGLSVLLGFLTAGADSYFAQLRPRRGLHHPDPRDA